MVITVTLNPAMDQVLVLDQLRPNVTNRVREQFYCVGGKGTHISINLSLLGIRSMAIGAVMGKTGDEIVKALKSMNIDVQFLQLPEGNCRTNYVLVDNEGNCTLVAEKGKLMEADVIDRLVVHYSQRIREGDIVVISGDASNQKHTGLQDTLINIAKEKGAKVCLDASEEHLAAGVKRGLFLIKPNLDELSFLMGRSLQSREDIIDAIKELALSGNENIIVSCGAEGSYAYSGGRYFHVIAPKVEAQNTVGCGDALVAGLLAGFERSLSFEENLKKASAVAAATAMNKATVGFDAGLVEQLAQQVIVEPL